MRLAVLFTLLPAILATPISQLAPLNANPHAQTIDDQYVVVFKKGVNPATIALHLDSIAASSLTSVSALIAMPRLRPPPVSDTRDGPHDLS